MNKLNKLKKFQKQLRTNQTIPETKLWYDSRRTKMLENAGFKVLRFWNNSVMQETQSVLETIFNELITPHPPQKARRPLPQGER